MRAGTNGSNAPDGLYVTLSELFFDPSATLDERSDEDLLLARLREANPAAVGEAYDAHHLAVRSFAQRLIGDNATAEDLVHEVFVSLPGAAARFRGHSSLRTFLLSIAVNHARHHVRSAARRRRALERLAREPERLVEGPEIDVQRRELGRALIRALDGLPLNQRVAFVLCEVEEHSSREAANITGAPEATIRTRLFHAKKKLRAALEQEGFR